MIHERCFVQAEDRCNDWVWNRSAFLILHFHGIYCSVDDNMLHILYISFGSLSFISTFFCLKPALMTGQRFKLDARDESATSQTQDARRIIVCCKLAISPPVSGLVCHFSYGCHLHYSSLLFRVLRIGRWLIPQIQASSTNFNFGDLKPIYWCGLHIQISRIICTWLMPLLTLIINPPHPAPQPVPQLSIYPPPINTRWINILQ